MAAPLRCRFRAVVEGFIGVAIAALTLQTWLVAGLVVPFEVASGSMAETLLGPHYRLVCARCQQEFACGADQPQGAKSAVCPRCGWEENDLAGQPVVPGDGVFIVRGAYWIRWPRRWEVIAFRPVDNPRGLAVKRVVGLPGETVRIYQGDVYINGSIARKSLREQLAVCQPVYFAGPQGSALTETGWLLHPDSPHSRWTPHEGGYRHPADLRAETADWLVFQRLDRNASGRGNGRSGPPVPVTDAMPYNQLAVRGEFAPQAAGELLYTFRLRATGQGRLELRAIDGQHIFRFVWEVTPEGSRYQVFEGQQVLPWPHRLGGLSQGRDLAMAVSLVDRQFLVAVDGEVLVAHPYDRGAPATTETPFALGVQSMGVEVRHMRVYRDVQYGKTIGAIARWGVEEPVVLGPGEFFVLGDNAAVSLDSRVWSTGPAVRIEQVVGRPLAVHFPVRLLHFGGVRIQVPAVQRIRYIR